MMKRHRNDGLRKLCDCPRRVWAKCEHSWYFNFKWAGEVYRFSLERRVGGIAKDTSGKWQRERATLGDVIADKTAAETERDRLRTAIREGTLQKKEDKTRPIQATLTLSAIMETYKKQHIAVHRPTTLKATGYIIGKIMRTELERADGVRLPFGEWLVADISTDSVEQYRQANLPAGTTGTNRHLELLRSLFNWATSKKRKLAVENPFRDSDQPAIKLHREDARRRRLNAGEGERLLTACTPHLRAVMECALETGMRRGEILSLQWWQVRQSAKAATIFLPAVKTKTKTDRTVPVSSRLLPMLDMRRAALAALLELKPDEELPGSLHVFGNEVGEPVADIKRAWHATILRANGHTPTYTKTGSLAANARATLGAIDLHFHDLRREAGSRWLDAGVPLHRIQRWLGHSNISQTSTYLMADSSDDDQEMRRFEERQKGLQRIATDSETGRHEGPQSDTMGDSNPQLSSNKQHRLQ